MKAKVTYMNFHKMSVFTQSKYQNHLQICIFTKGTKTG